MKIGDLVRYRRNHPRLKYVGIIIEQFGSGAFSANLHVEWCSPVRFRRTDERWFHKEELEVVSENR